MTTHQDQPPLSRRALRQERARAEEIDDSAEADRAPSGRRARAAAPEGLVEVPNAAEVTNDEQPAVADAAAEASSNPESADSTTVSSTAEGTEAESVPVLTDSAVPKAFPFAGQVEATSDDAGHPGFRLRDFTPELSTARSDAQSAHDWTPTDDESVALDYQTQGAPAFGYVSPYAESTSATTPAPEASFDSLFSDLLAPEAETQPDTEAQAAASAEDADAVDDTPVPVGEPIVVDEPVAPVAPVEVAQEERTLSRREWRAMRAAAEAAAAAEAGDSETDSDTVPESDVDAPSQDTAEEAPSTSDVELLFQEPEVEQLDVEQPEVEQPDVEQPDVEQPEVEQPDVEQPAAEAHEDATEESEPLDIERTGSAFIPPLVEPAAAPQSALSDAMAEFEALTREPLDANPTMEPAVHDFEQQLAPAVFPELPKPESTTPAVDNNTPFSFLVNPAPAVEPSTPTDAQDPADNDASAYTPPIGHWSRQAELDDENQPFENTLSRDVGGGNVATTTNALVLPMIPQRDDFSSVLNATGEIMVTGTINLPGSVGTTGRDSRHYDDPEVDHLFDAFDNEIPNTDSAPVRAITAVSSHTATRGGIEPGRKQNNRVLTILLVTAGVLAVGVCGLLVAGFVFHIF